MKLIRFLRAIIATVAFIVWNPVQSGAQNPAPTHDPDGQFIREWLILGPFQSTDLSTDYLRNSGGEATADPKEGDTVTTSDGRILSWTRYQSDLVSVAVGRALGAGASTTTYAFCLLRSDSTGEAQIRFGHNASSVWMNGIRVPKSYDRGSKGLANKIAQIHLNEGTNRCLIKIAENNGDRTLAARVFPDTQPTWEGRVTDRSGQAVSRALIRLLQNGRLVDETRSDPSGYYQVTAFKRNGVFDLSVVAGDSGTWRLGLSPENRDPRQMDLTIEKATSISGTVLALDGKTPQIAVPVQALASDDAEGSSNVASAVLSDDTGSFRFVNLKPGSYRIRCQTRESVVYFNGIGTLDATEGSVLVVEPGITKTGVDFRIPEVKKGVWNSYTTLDGLPQHRVTSVQRTADGFIWFGTQRGGIARFDGNSFKNFEEGNGMQDSQIEAFDVAPDGALWIATHAGVTRFDGTFFKDFTEADGLVNNLTHAIRVEPNGSVWIGTELGVSHFDGERFANYRVEQGLPHGQIHDIHRTTGGDIWFATGDGVSRFNGNRFENLNPNSGFANRIVYRIVEAADGALWFATVHGVVRYDGENFFRYTTLDGLGDDWVYDIHEAKDGSVWFATNGGVSCLMDGRFVNYTTKDGLVDQAVRVIFPGVDGALWFGTENGVSRFDPEGIIQFGTADGLVRENGELAGVLSIKRDLEGKIWVGTEWGGAFRLEERSLKNMTVGLGRLYVRTIECTADGILWLGTDSGILKFDGKQFEKVVNQKWIMALSADSSGNLWFGHGWAGGGVSRYDPLLGTMTTFTVVDGLRHDNIWAIEPTLGESIWLGGYGGLSRYMGNESPTFDNPETRVSPGSLNFIAGDIADLSAFTLKLQLQSNKVSSYLMKQFSERTRQRVIDFNEAQSDLRPLQDALLQDLRIIVRGEPIYDADVFADVSLSEETKQLLERKPKGETQFRLNRLLIKDAYPEELAGLASTVRALHLDPGRDLWFGGAGGLGRFDGKKAHRIEKRDGLPDDRIWSITQTPDGVVWIGTDSGGLAGFDGEAVTSIDTRDGLAGTSIFAVETDSQGTIWAGAQNGGLIRYRRGTHRPGIRLTGVDIDENSFRDLASVPDIRSGHRVTLNFSEIDFKTHADKRMFKYRITDTAGFQVSQGLIKERRVDWTPRKEGGFKFEVQAIDRDLHYSEPAALTLTISPLWYRNPMIAIPLGGGACAMSLLCLLFGSNYYRQRQESVRLRNRMLEQERQVRIKLEESQERLRTAKELADAANKSKSAFLASMSHELRTPLNAIIGYSELVSEELQDSGQVEMLPDINRISQSGKHLLGLINDILDLSKIEANKMTFFLENFGVKALVDDVVATVQPLAAKNGNQIDVHCSAEIGQMFGDQTKLRQTLLNLLSNALKFTENGTVTVRVSREDEILKEEPLAPDTERGLFADSSSLIRFSVIDNGIGMTPEQLDKLFRPFAQAASSTSKKYGGTGLGLAISRRLCRLMGGDLTSASEFGKGSVFHITVPSRVKERM